MLISVVDDNSPGSGMGSSKLTTLLTRQVLQAIVLSYLDYCSVVWSGATKRDLGKLQLAQNRAAGP